MAHIFIGMCVYLYTIPCDHMMRHMRALFHTQVCAHLNTHNHRASQHAAVAGKGLLPCLRCPLNVRHQHPHRLQWCDEGPVVFRSNQPSEYEILKVQLFNLYKTIQFMDTYRRVFRPLWTHSAKLKSERFFILHAERDIFWLFMCPFR